MGEEFVNWSGSLRFSPQRIEKPETEEQLADIIVRAGEQGQDTPPFVPV